MIKTVIIVFLSLFFFGNIYFWTDENGVKHFTNTTPSLNYINEEFEESQVISQKPGPKEDQKQGFEVIRVFDGDTIQVRGLDLIFKVRLVAIDSPEIGYKGQKSQPFSQQARQRLTHLLENKKIRIKSYGTGGYNRQLAEVFAGDKNINIEMIKAGLAEVYSGSLPKNLDSKMYLKEELKARQSRKGIWRQGRAYKSPRQWRKEHPRK